MSRNATRDRHQGENINSDRNVSWVSDITLQRSFASGSSSWCEMLDQHRLGLSSSTLQRCMVFVPQRGEYHVYIYMEPSLNESLDTARTKWSRTSAMGPQEYSSPGINCGAHPPKSSILGADCHPAGIMLPSLSNLYPDKFFGNLLSYNPCLY